MSTGNRHQKKRITNATIHPHKVIDWVMDSKAGGTAVFIGSVRQDGQMGKIVGMRYESYLEMAEEKMLSIERSVVNKFKILRVNMIHRVGDLSIGEISVVVAVSAPHRLEAFRACRYVVERIKREVPIWKKEKLVGGIGVWVRK
jgi:molybdopterin synthase catalytic subunit